MLFRAALAAAVLSFGAGSAHASSIGVFFAPDGSDCDGTATPGVPFTVYIGAVLGGDAAAGGIFGAEFSLIGADPTWITTITPSPALDLVLGNPVLNGCNIAFPACQPGPFVPLYTIQFTAPAAVSPRAFRIWPHQTPSGPNFLCPLVLKCDAPVWTKVCVSGGQAFLNDPSRVCTVGIESRNWTAVKSLFR